VNLEFEDIFVESVMIFQRNSEKYVCIEEMKIVNLEFKGFMKYL
jgi:hypothetical protein